MKILQTEIYEESKVIPKLGEDFTRCQLDDFYGTGVFSLNSEMLTFIVMKNGFDEWVWIGNFNECMKEIEALFRKNIAEKLNKDNKRTYIEQLRKN